jgi:hypothetical protein
LNEIISPKVTDMFKIETWIEDMGREEQETSKHTLELHKGRMSPWCLQSELFVYVVVEVSRSPHMLPIILCYLSASIPTQILCHILCNQILDIFVHVSSTQKSSLC